MKKLALVSAVILAFALQNATAQTLPGYLELLTTADDFNNAGTSTGNGSTVTVLSGFSLDNNNINGLNNSAAPGGAGTAGALAIQFPSGPTYNYSEWVAGVGISSWEEPLINAIDPGSIGSYNSYSSYGPGTLVAYSGNLSLTYSVPDNEGGSYFQLGITLNYDNNYGTFWTENPTYLGMVTVPGSILGPQSVYQATIPYTINATSLTYFQMGIAYNSDYDPVDPFVIDDIEVQAIPEPGTMALVGMGALGFAFLARRRRA